MATHSAPWPAGTPCWLEIMVSDLARSQEFYRAVLGWEFEDSGPDYGHYANALVGGRRVAGISPPMEGDGDWPKVWTTYFATEGLEATAQAAEAAGAAPAMDLMDVGAFGRMGLWVDPTGAAFGAWEARAHTGYDAHNEHGAVGWIDLTTPDLDRAKAFYREVFGFHYEDMPMGEMDYAMFTPPSAEIPAGGMGSQPAEDALGPRWCVTFEVDDVDAARQRVLEAGGSAPEAPWDFEHGRITTVAGPDGEEFSLITPRDPTT